MKTDFTGKKVAILGYGVNNAELVPFLQNRGANLTICDKNPDLEQLEGVSYRLGPDYLENLTDFDVIFRTPGLPFLTQQIQEARIHGSRITSQTELFMEECEAKIIGVTGTKGKGTTSSLIAMMLRYAVDNGDMKGKIHLAGNIGISPLSLLEVLTAEDWVVLELSSFQLQGIRVSPHIAVVLNVTSDHLDHHRTVNEYHEAKQSLVKHQTNKDFAILYADSPTTRAFESVTKANVYHFSTHKDVIQGVFIEDDSFILRQSPCKDETICPTSTVNLVGRHSLENVAAAITASVLAGAKRDSICEGIANFTGLHHRLQFVAEVNGVRYYDDSKATTPDSTIAAFQSFDNPVTLILGGSSKGADYTELVNAMKTSNVTQVICIGQEGERLQKLFTEAQVPQTIMSGEKNMAAIVEQAAKITQPNNIVLLSPAAASFDMFKNADDRGEQFQEAVHNLA